MGQVENFALRLTNVSKSYGRVHALENLSFTVAEGRFFVLFGPSSVGKTTALRTIAGLVTPERGRLEIFGKDWTQEPIAGRGVSMVFQSFALYPHLTVYKNFAYPLVEAGLARAEIGGRVKRRRRCSGSTASSTASPARCRVANNSASPWAVP